MTTSTRTRPGPGAAAPVTRAAVLRHRVRVQQLDRPAGSAAGPTDADVLAVGVQDTGPDGSLWALAVRGVPVRAGAFPEELALAWTLRGAPHLYRRADLPSVQRALRPFSDDDAARRVLDASRPWRAAGLRPLDAWARVAAAQRALVREPVVKGELSTLLTAELGEPYTRWCRPCGATHLYEQSFRLPALHAGLELVPGTSPPVLRPVPGWPPEQVGQVERADDEPDGEHDVVRLLLHLLGPMTPKQAAELLDAPLADVRRRWPSDAVEVEVDGRRSGALPADAAALQVHEDVADEPLVRLLGPYDLYLQGRDRDLLVPDAARRKALWPVLGRPGAVLVDGEVVGTWRPRTRGRRLGLELDPWVPWDAATTAGVEREHARLAAFRGLSAG
ncbi:DNA glycosylase AlkZ-like family protein [Cellulomonas massiliensis]|uniref:DNA glycosylase AlkZ-like family protein n=1 Tax=Cellulomonas massiliensis TaxID=1465811 RepID=UPI0002D3354E|nr:crosslink repair DNA glycosylase YcaQ family protein [Cellulomonas massiliensis]